MVENRKAEGGNLKMEDRINLRSRIQKDEAGTRYRHPSAIAHKFLILEFGLKIRCRQVY